MYAAIVDAHEWVEVCTCSSLRLGSGDLVVCPTVAPAYPDIKLKMLKSMVNQVMLKTFSLLGPANLRFLDSKSSEGSFQFWDANNITRDPSDTNLFKVLTRKIQLIKARYSKLKMNQRIF